MNLIDRLKTYKEFVASHEQQNDWGSYRDKWIEDVAALFHTIEMWLSDLVKGDMAKIELIPVRRYEEYVGEYSTHVLEITFLNNKTIVFEPISSIVLNYEGKIDLFLRGDRMNMVHVFRKVNDGKATWEVVDANASGKAIGLTKASLEKLLLNKWLT